MKSLNQLRVEAEISIPDFAEILGLSYIETAKIFQGKDVCSDDIKKRIKIALINNYTNCIDKALRQTAYKKGRKTKNEKHISFVVLVKSCEIVRYNR